MNRLGRLAGAAFAPVIALAPLLACAEPADMVLTDARIYTADAARPSAEALAVKDGRIVYVGDAAGVRTFVGPATMTEDAHGARVLPGLVDAHMHPTAGLYAVDVCDLKSEARTLAQITAFVKACLARYQPKPGEWLSVTQWNFTAGNQTDASHPTLRAALDLVSTTTPIQLIGDDYHHGAFNSAALARARNDRGQRVGYSKATLRADFGSLTKLIGVDAQGEPNGAINEDARDRMGSSINAVFDTVMREPEKTMLVLNRDGITAIQDAAVSPSTLTFYDTLQSRGRLTVRVNLAQLMQPEDYRRSDGAIDYDRMVAEAIATRTRYAADPLIRADVVKLFADGVLEGNPLADPPTLPESPALRPFLQPIFGRDAHGDATLKGYVDTASPACMAVRSNPQAYSSAQAIARFKAAHGNHPMQCLLSSGRLQHPREVILEYLKRMHHAGFTLHVHAIGDAAVRAALDGIEQARSADPSVNRPDAIAHLQLVAPEDVARLGRDHIYGVFTYSWAVADKSYDLTVIPFVQRVKDDTYEGLHDPNGYYERQAYPTLSAKRAGLILAAGSDAPVGGRDPQPFQNMQIGVTRMRPGGRPLGPQERLNIRDVVDAYTINGAKALGREAEIGSITPGKSADFIILDRDIIGLADAGHPEDVGQTRVMETWFMGRKVYAAGAD